MQFSTFAVSALCMGGALAQQMIKTHVVRVGSLTGDLTFSPSQLTASAGDMVQFQFAPKNHSVVQSTFDQPCQPASLNSNITGLYSGYIPVAASDVNTATWTIAVNDTKPIWLYCSQGRHCQSGMVMVINPPAANASRTLESYRALAAAAQVNLPGDAIQGGNQANTTAPADPTGGSGTPTETGAPTGTDASSTPSISNTNAATSHRVGAAATFGGALALVFALLL